MKKYKTWVRITVEEIDEDRDVYRNVVEVGGKLVKDEDPMEFSIYEVDSYAAAREAADVLAVELMGIKETR